MTAAFEEEALREYQEAAQYSENRFGLGRSFVTAVEEALNLIKDNPQMHQSVGAGIRIFRMRRYPYYHFYHHEKGSDAITVYAVAHHKRKPGYWRERLKNTKGNP
jgi:toxin ParE1/3/4